MKRGDLLWLVAALTLAVGIGATEASAWDGYDYDTGSYIDIDPGNSVQTGQSIDYFDYNDADYHSATVDSVQRSGSSVEVDVTDDETGQSRSLDMDDDE